MYSDKVLDHYTNPRNVGALDKTSPDLGGTADYGDIQR
jgi:nitrogen fixation NifU-like protein